MPSVNPALPHWMQRLIAPRVPAAPSSSLLPSRIEVCPPELWPSSLGWRATLRRWLQRSRWLPATARPANRLAQVKQEFRHAAADLPAALLAGLGDRIEAARSLREFWHLRSSLYNALALGLDQTEADRRLLRLNRHFPIRAPRTTVAA
jgi:hypothetical protein